MELLDIRSDDLVDAFYERVEARYSYLVEQYEEEDA